MTAMDDLLMAAALTRLETASADAGRSGTQVTVVVDDAFTLESFVRGIVGFAAAVPQEEQAAWHRAFTRTVFLAGRPASLRSRHPARHETEGLAWYGPAPDARLRNLSRLLKAFHGPAPAVPKDVLVPGDGPIVRVAVAVRGVSVRDYLVHLHHLIAEATLRGLVRPGAALRVTHHPDLDSDEFRELLDPACAGAVQTRITHDDRDPGRLRLYAVLTPEV